MKRSFLKCLIASCFILLAESCANSYFYTVWKGPDIRERRYHKILVAGIMPDADSMLRIKLETSIAERLRLNGYVAAAASEEYGMHGLADLGEEETFVRLCSSGTDAVVIFSLLDRNRESDGSPARAANYPSSYYYSRIWHYKDIEAETATTQTELTESEKYYWECSIFDLSTLEVQFVVQSRVSLKGSLSNVSEDFGNRIGNLLSKRKILHP